jgi:tripartite-type tricarboxylate transporter receptor subunit TctC
MRRSLAASLAALVLGFHPVSADDYPSKPIHVVVPVTAGSAIDVVARIVADQLAIEFSEPVVVENRTGAGGTIGAALIAKSNPDGYAVLVHSSAHVIAASTFSNLPYDVARDFAGVTALANVPLVLVVSPAKYKSIAELVAVAKAKAGAINYATVGIGAAAHLTAERFRLSAGFTAQQIPFKGGPEAITEVLAQRVDFLFTPVLTALPLIRDGRLLGLAVSSSKRAAALPDVPTTLEAGFANSDYNYWIGMYVPAGTAHDIIVKLNRETHKILQTRAVQEKFGMLGGEPMAMSPEEFDAFTAREIRMNAALVSAAGILPH